MPIQYTDSSLDVPPGVDFLDAAQAATWVAACEVDKPWRDPMRRHFSELILRIASPTRVLELGCGPGILAEAILTTCPNVTEYTLMDFSSHMLALSRARMGRFEAARFVEADFKRSGWSGAFPGPYSAVVAMQAVHEIRHKRHAVGLYRQIREVLKPGGVLAVCDGEPRDASVLYQVNLFMTADEQLEALDTAGFSQVRLERRVGSMIFVTGTVPG